MQPQPPTPQPLNPQPNLTADVQAAIDAAVSQVESKYADRIAQLEAQVKAQQPFVPSGQTTEHAAGPGYETSQTWGQWHQELARAGKLTGDILKDAGYVAKVV